jgi:DNA polymerase-1
MNEQQRKIFDSLKNESVTSMNVNSRVMIVDSLNVFISAFSMIRHVNYYGSHIGGLTGFLRSLGSYVNTIKPTRVILVFDGKGSSTNKKYIYPEYKANRGITRITNWDIFENQKEESEAIKNQIVRLVDYLQCLPVDMVSVDKIEADDVIGYMSKQFDNEVIIVSTDRDYLQLVNEKVTVYSPKKKMFMDPHSVKKEYGVSPVNFLNQKVVIGDKGDNVPGVKGIAAKTFSKMFPEMIEERRFSIEEMLKKCEEENGNKYKDVGNFKHQILINEKLMNLLEPNISEQDQEYLQSVISNPKKSLNTMDFIKLYNEDSLGSSIVNVNQWLFDRFRTLSHYK